MSGPTSTLILFGCVLAHPTWLPDIIDLFVESDFAEAVEKKVWSTFAELHEQGKTATPIDVLGALAEVQGGTDTARDLSELMSLCELETPRTFQSRVDDLIKSTKHRRVKRRLKKLVGAVDEMPDLDWGAQLDLEAQKIRKLDRRRKHYTPLTFDRFEETASNKRRKVVIPSGFRGIDERIGGFVVGHETLVCARTNVGKSSFLAALARNQFLALAARNPDREHKRNPKQDPYTTRLEPAHARHPKNEKVGERAPFVLILSVEDDLDDYLGRIVCDLCDVRGNDYLLDPEHAVFGAGKREQYLQVGHTLTDDGRLTIADYESEDGDDEKTIGEIEKTILGWKQLVEAPFIERDEAPPPLLVLLDYFQKVELPNEEGKSSPEHVLLKKASARLHKLAKRQDFALVMAVMLLRAPDDIEPDHNSARGGSDVVQDAEVVLTLWPFGPGERSALEELKPSDNVTPIRPLEVADTFEGAAGGPDDYSEFEDLDGDEEDDEGEPLDAVTLRRACNELLVAGHKGRHVQAGWQVPLEFDRDHKRITDAFDMGVVFRRHPDIVSTLKAHRKSQGERKR